MAALPGLSLQGRARCATPSAPSWEAGGAGRRLRLRQRARGGLCRAGCAGGRAPPSGQEGHGAALAATPGEEGEERAAMGPRAESSTGTGRGASPLASSGAGRLWRLSNLVMAVFFGLAGVVQINDPDPGLWIAAYSVPAALTLVVSFNPPIADNVVWKSLSDLHSVACAVGAAILGYSLVANAQQNILHEEEGRELLGLLIVTVWMSLCRSSAKNSLGGVRVAIAIFLSLFPFVMWLYIYMSAEMRASWPSHCKTVI